MNRKPLRNCLSLAQPCIPRNSPPLTCLLPRVPVLVTARTGFQSCFSLFSHCPGVLGRNSAPRKIPLLRLSASPREERSIGFIA